jgi:hypothetical protein
MKSNATEGLQDWIGVLWRPVSIFSKIAPSLPNAWRWKWALVILIGMEVLSQILIFNQPAIFEQARADFIARSQEKMKQDGISSEQIRQAVLEMQDTRPFFFIFLNSTRAVMETAARLAMITAAFWVLLRAVLNKFPTLNPALEVAGLSMSPMFPGMAVKLAMVLSTGSLNAGPSAAMFLTDPQPLDFANIALSILNPFHLWTCLLLALAAINIWKTKPRTTIFWVYAGWAIVWFGFAFLQKSISLRGA